MTQPKKASAKKRANTSWGSVSQWYDDYLEGADTYQEKVIAPNLLRILALRRGERILDLACGQGYFSRLFAQAGAQTEGTDVSPELLEAARAHGGGVAYHAAAANDLSFAVEGEYDAAAIVLALQNIEDMDGAIAEASRVLKTGGRFVLVLNHPAFRIPKRSSWGNDDAGNVQYRRVDAYLSPSRENITMHPGQEGSASTISYHRSLQDIFKSLAKSGFVIARLEEWISHKKSEKGPRQKAEDAARKEIPLFLALEASKL